MASSSAFAQKPTAPEPLKVAPKAAAITKSIMPVKSDGALQVEAVTVSTSPVFLKAGRVKSPSGKYYVTTGTGDPSMPAAGSDVRQRWSWKIQPAEKGKYSATFGVGVVAGAGIPQSNVWVFEFQIQ